MSTDFDFAGVRLKGARDYQQDYYAFCPVEAAVADAALLLVVADGAGGLANGGDASKAAVEGFMDAFFSSSREGEDRLTEALQGANARVGEAVGGAPDAWEEAGAASTLVAVHATSSWFEWISAGDSILLHVRDGILIRRNADHSMRQSATQGGSVLVSALTGAPIPAFDAKRLPWQPGDWLLAGTDGLLTLTEQEIAEEISNANLSADKCADALAAKVTGKARPRQDNVTIALMRNSYTKDLLKTSDAS